MPIVSIPQPKDLHDSLRVGMERLERPREQFLAAVQEYVGRRYGKDDGRNRPLNLIHRGINVFVPFIASRNGTHDLAARRMALRGEAIKQSLLLDHVSEQLQRVKITRRLLLDAFLGPKAIARVGIRAGDEVYTVGGRSYQRGAPYILPISLDDWCQDPAARCDDECAWEAHCYRIPRQTALQSGVFNPRLIERLPSIQDGRMGERRRELDRLTRVDNAGASDFDLIDLIELWDVVLYGDGQSLVTTIAGATDNAGQYLREPRPYQGPGRGPYHHLEFYPVPGQPHGVPPVFAWMEQAETFYKLVNKYVSEALAMKTMVAGPREAEDDLKTARDMPDSGVALFDDPKQIGNLEVGKAMPELMGAAGQFSAFFNTAAGNPDILAGTDAQTDKATIYQGQQANAANLLDDLVGTHDNFQADLSRGLLFWLRGDPSLSQPLTHRLPGGETIEVVFSNAQRNDDLMEYQIKLRPRSMGRQDQNARIANVRAVMNDLMIGAQLSAATGGLWDVAAQARIEGRLADIDELDELVKDPILQMQVASIYGQFPMPGQGVAVNAPGVEPQPQVPPGAAGGMAAGMQQQQGARPPVPQGAGGAPGRGSAGPKPQRPGQGGPRRAGGMARPAPKPAMAGGVR